MEPIVSGSTTERIVRTSIVTGLALFASGYCFYDGYVGYPRENLKRAVQALSPPPESTPPIVQTLTSETAPQGGQEATLSDLIARWGEPGWRHGNEARYFGPGGQLILTLRGDRISKSEYRESAYKNELDLKVQKVMGIGIGLIALVLLGHWLRVVLGRTTMTEDGIRAGGRRIPFDSITGLNAENYARKGWVDVEYAIDGRTDTLRLDDYKIKAFPAMIEEICRRRGFENPHARWLAEKAARAARAPASVSPESAAENKT